MSEVAFSTIYTQLVATRQRIVDTLFEIDDIELQQNPRIQAEYASSVGYLENNLLKWQLTARRLRRKLTLLRAAANSGQAVSNQQLDTTLDKEFSDWEQLLARRVSEQMAQLERKSSMRCASPSKSKEIVQIHRTLVKRLHPDIHPHQSDEAKRFFAMAQSAYKDGDLRLLRALLTATEDYEEPLATKSQNASEDDLEVSLAMAEAQLAVSQEHLSTLKSSRPYTLRALLDDHQELANLQKSLETRIEEQKHIASAFEQSICDLLGECHE